MKSKYPIILISLIFIIALYFIGTHNSSNKETNGKDAVSQKKGRRKVVKPTSMDIPPNRVVEKKIPKSDLVLVHVKEPANANAVVYPQYRVGGTSGGKLTIRNFKGDLLLRGNDDVSVYAAKGSPTGKMVWVLSGDGRSFVISDRGVKLFDLPQFPLGKNMQAFSRWHWIDDNNLLGESGVQKYDKQGKLVACCGGDDMSESRFYIYDLRTKIIAEVRLPKKLRGKVVSIGKVLKTGELQLMHRWDGTEWYDLVVSDENKH